MLGTFPSSHGTSFSSFFSVCSSWVFSDTQVVKIVDSDWRTKKMQQIGGGHPVKSVGVLDHEHGMSLSILNHSLVDDFFFFPKSCLAINNVLQEWLQQKEVLFMHLLVCLIVYSHFCYREFRPFTLQGVTRNPQEVVLSLMVVWTVSMLLRFLRSNVFTRHIYFCFSLLITASLPVTRTYVTKMPPSCPLSGTICRQNHIKFTSQISLAICPPLLKWFVNKYSSVPLLSICSTSPKVASKYKI